MTTVLEVCTLLSKIYEILATVGYVEVIPVELEMMMENEMKRCSYHQEMIRHDVEKCLRFRAEV